MFVANLLFPRAACGLAAAAAIVLNAFVLVAPGHGASPAPGAAAPDAAVAPAPGPDRAAGLDTFPASRPPAGPSRLDENGNRLSDGLEARLAELGPGDGVDVIVTFDGPGSAAAAQRAVGPFEVRHEYRLISGFAATMTAAQARALAQAPGVFRVQLDGTVYGLMETARRDFGVDLPDGSPAIPGVTGDGVVICVVDSGVWPEHEQFVDPVDQSTKVEKFRDFVGEGASDLTEPGTQAHDEHYHGTMVSAIAAGDGTAQPDARGGDPVLAGPLRGVAPGAALWGAQVIEPAPDGTASGPDSGVVAAIDWCVAEWQQETAQGSPRRLVINLSLGSPGGCAGDPVAAAVDAAYDAGAVVIAAAGNSGDGTNSVGIPACAAGAFPVAAAADYSLPDTPELAGIESNGYYIAPFSSRGDAMVSGAAGPGVTIGSAFNTDQSIFATLGCDMVAPDGGPASGCYVASSGTSFAAPFVAGLAALILEAAPGSTPAEVYGALRATARPWGPGGASNIVAGAGLVDGQAAVAAASGAAACMDYTQSPAPLYTTEVSSVARNGSVQIPIWVEDPALPLAITMTIDGSVRRGVWSPDLDMYLLDANGDPYMVPNPLYPWLSPDEFIPAPGTSSTCPLGEDCGTLGVQETLHLPLPPVVGDLPPVSGSPTPHYYLEVRPWEGSPNNGKGGSFTLELSNAWTDASTAPPPPCVLMADAGPDQDVALDEGADAADVTLDGSGSTGGIVSYVWTTTTPGVVIPDGMITSVSLPQGDHAVTLTVTDVDGVPATDTVLITVKQAKKGGGGNGGGCKNPNKPCG